MSNAVFPTFLGLAWPVKRTPIFNTSVKAAASGLEVRAAFMAYPLYRIDLTFDYLSLDDWQTLGGFFKSRKGKFDSFLFDDIGENKITNQVIGIGAGGQNSFQLIRSAGGFVEPVENPKPGVSIYIDGSLQTSGYEITSTGIVNFYSMPSGVISWSGGYYWRVRFDQDSAEFSENLKTFFDLKKLTFYGATGNKV